MAQIQMTRRAAFLKGKLWLSLPMQEAASTVTARPFIQNTTEESSHC